jgi:hypothetical protein
MSNLPNTSTEVQNNKRLFNGSFYQVASVTEETYNIVLSFFFERTKDRQSADMLTQSLVTLGYNNKLNPLDILKEFDKPTSDSDLKKVMIAVLNSSRFPTSKLGYQGEILPNKWTSRNIAA